MFFLVSAQVSFGNHLPHVVQMKVCVLWVTIL